MLNLWLNLTVTKDDPLTWQYDEFKQVGRDYGLASEVEVYDASHSQFRDAEKESLVILDNLKVRSEHMVVDFGTGTGTFAIEAARRCHKVIAVDVSKAMLDYAEKKAVRANIKNIDFCHGGFLSYNHQGSGVDAINTTFAFHHLPDFWKGIALARIYRLLKPGGLFHIMDVILEQGNVLGNISEFIDKQTALGGDFLREDARAHFREEFSTYDWVIDGLLQRAGFDIVSKEMTGGIIGNYVCVKRE